MLHAYLLLIGILSRIVIAEATKKEDQVAPEDDKLARKPRGPPIHVDGRVDFGEIIMSGPSPRSESVPVMHFMRKPTGNRWARSPQRQATCQVLGLRKPRTGRRRPSSSSSSSRSSVSYKPSRLPRCEVREPSSSSSSHHQYCRPIIASSSSSSEDHHCQPCRRGRLASSSSSCEPQPSCGGCEEVNHIEIMDFYHTYPRLEGAGKTWSYFNFLNYTADGGNLMTGCKGGFLDTREYYTGLGRNPFPELDHYKYYIYADDLAPIPKRGSLVIEWKVSVETFKTCRNPFGDRVTLPFDPRLACAGFNAYDPKLALSFNFLVTSDRVYIMYARDPYQRVALEKAYASFTYIIPVKKRSCSEVNRLRVVFDEAKKEVKWYVDYRLVYRLTKVGHRLWNRQYMTQDYTGNDNLVYPESIQYGFGSFTFLDHYPVCAKAEPCDDCHYPASWMALVRLGDPNALKQYDPLLGYPHEATYYDDFGKAEYRLWGQGSETRLFKLSVYQLFKDCKIDCDDLKIVGEEQVAEKDATTAVAADDESQFLMLADE